MGSAQSASEAVGGTDALLDPHVGLCALPMRGKSHVLVQDSLGLALGLEQPSRARMCALYINIYLVGRLTM